MTEQILYGLYGGGAGVFAIVGLVFVRYWILQRERLFVFFAAAFFFFALGCILRVLTGVDEHRGAIFVPRLIGYLLIIVAIFEKNRRAGLEARRSTGVQRTVEARQDRAS